MTSRSPTSIPAALRAITLRILLFLCAGFSAAPSQAQAQDEAVFDAILMERLGLFEAPHSGARSVALGGGGVAWSEDLQSLSMNPAGLASIARIETQLGFRRQAFSQEVNYFGTSNHFEPASIGLDALGFAYPLPTYRGALVIAAGLFRQHDAVSESLWEGVNAYDGDYEFYSLQMDGGPLSWIGGAGMALSQSADVGLSLEYLNGGLDVLSRFDLTSPAGNDTLLRDLGEDHYDFRGWRAHFGLLTHIGESLQMGFRLTTPTLLNVDGESHWQQLDLESGSVFHESSGFFVFEEELRLPYRFAGGLVARHKIFSLSGELEYVDWNQTRVDGRRLRDLRLRPALKEAVDQRYGLQIESPDYPLRLYLGYYRLGEPLQFLESGEFVDGFALLKELDLVASRQGFSAGAGLFLSESLLLEAGFAQDRVERRTRPEPDGRSDLKQENRRRAFGLTFSYRF